ncbi:MAG: hypothetical protein ABJA81_10175 [Nocardioidaceae bacterium]
MIGLSALWRRIRTAELATRPVHPETRVALARRWPELPDSARTPAQTLSQHAVGCEGTHGVFPRCNLARIPCYHSATPTESPLTAHTPSARPRLRWASFLVPEVPGRTPS